MVGSVIQMKYLYQILTQCLSLFSDLRDKHTERLFVHDFLQRCLPHVFVRFSCARHSASAE